MNRKKCYCSNKFCKCLFGCGCTVPGSGYGKCMCCIMEENDKRLRRRGNVTIEKNIDPGEGGKCNCDFDEPKFYDIIVALNNDDYWSCRYGCLVEINNGEFNISSEVWTEEKIDKNNPYQSDIKITYDTPKVENSDDVNILIVKEENLKHVWCEVNGKPNVSLN